MSNASDDTPLLERDVRTDGRGMGMSTDHHFKPIIKLLTVSISILSMITFNLLVVIYFWITAGPYHNVGNSQGAVKDLAICVRKYVLVLYLTDLQTAHS